MINDFTFEDNKCSICHGVGIVCESHPFSPWDDSIDEGCECSPGMPCLCNRNFSRLNVVDVIAEVDVYDD